MEKIKSTNQGGEEKGIRGSEVEGMSEQDLSVEELRLLDQLDEMSLSELTSLLLYLYERKIDRLTPAEVMESYMTNRFVQPAVLDLVRLKQAEAMLMESLTPGFEMIELSPVAPVGTCSVLTHIDPKTILQTVRSLEVVNDTSTVMALESARRRMNDERWYSSDRRNIEPVNLANIHRELRMQQFPQKHLRQHFSSFTLTTAGRDIGRFSFEKNAQLAHLNHWLRSLTHFSENGAVINNITVYLSDLNIIQSLIDEGSLSREEVVRTTRDKRAEIFRANNILLPTNVDDISSFDLVDPGKVLNRSLSTLRKMDGDQIMGLREHYPGVNFVYDLSRTAGLGYYDGLCFKVKATNKVGQEISLIDGGASPWTAELTSDDKERFYGSGLGTEVLVNEFLTK